MRISDLGKEARYAGPCSDIDQTVAWFGVIQHRSHKKRADQQFVANSLPARYAGQISALVALFYQLKKGVKTFQGLRLNRYTGFYEAGF